MRGAPHVHMKIWVKDAPVYGVDSEEIILEFIQKYISCELPDEKLNPMLFDLVSKYQAHRCSASCKRFITKGGKCFTKCRYGFPRAVNNKASLNTLQSTIKSRKKGKNPIKLYNLLRNNNEQFINDYNPLCLLLWEGNMDIQYIPEKSMILNRYISSYVTKAEKNATKKLWEDCNKNRSLHGALKSFALQSFKNREVGAYEVADKLMGYPLFGKSCAIKWLGIGFKYDRKRRLKDKRDIESLDASSTDLFHNNLIDTYYPNRPDSLEHNCLFDLASYFDFKKEKCLETLNHEKCVSLKNNLGYLHKRSERYLIKTPRYNPIKNETKENYFHMLLMLFKPWRNENDLLGTSNSYADAFEIFLTSNKNNSLLQEFQFRQNLSNDIGIKAAEINKQVDNEIEKEDEKLKSNEEEMPFQFEIPIFVNNETVLNERIEKLNKYQKEVFDKVFDELKHQDLHKEKHCLCDLLRPIRLFCSGSAGK